MPEIVEPINVPYVLQYFHSLDDWFAHHPLLPTLVAVYETVGGDGSAWLIHQDWRALKFASLRLRGDQGTLA